MTSSPGRLHSCSFFFFNDTATTEIYTLSLHDALPISPCARDRRAPSHRPDPTWRPRRSEEHTSELQSRGHLVCRLLLEKKKTYNNLPGGWECYRKQVGVMRGPARA